MADNLTISTGSGTTIATDQVGTAHYQKIKLVVGSSDTATSLVFGQTNMTASLPVVVASDQSTLDVSVVAFTPGGTQDVTIVNPLYSVAGTNMGATGTGIMMIGVQSGATTGRALALTVSGNAFCQVATGTVNVVNTPTVTVSTALAFTVGLVTTGTVDIANTPTVTVSTALALTATVNTGQYYSVGATNMGATATGIIFLGVVTNATTGRAIALTASGGQYVAQVATGTVSIAPMYVVGATTIAATGTGILMMGKQSGATTSRCIVVATTGEQICQISTGTVNVVAMPVLSASNVTIASITTGTLSVVNVLSATGVTLATTTAIVGAFVKTSHGSSWNAYAVSTTSGAAMILKTSGGHTLYVTDLLFSVDVPMSIEVRSATTAKATVYLATKGGFVFPTVTPFICNSAESLIFQPSLSGSCAGYAAGYTVT